MTTLSSVRSDPCPLKHVDTTNEECGVAAIASFVWEAVYYGVLCMAHSLLSYAVLLNATTVSPNCRRLRIDGRCVTCCRLSGAYALGSDEGGRL